MWLKLLIGEVRSYPVLLGESGADACILVTVCVIACTLRRVERRGKREEREEKREKRKKQEEKISGAIPRTKACGVLR